MLMVRLSERFRLCFDDAVAVCGQFLSLVEDFICDAIEAKPVEYFKRDTYN